MEESWESALKSRSLPRMKAAFHRGIEFNGVYSYKDRIDTALYWGGFYNDQDWIDHLLTLGQSLRYDIIPFHLNRGLYGAVKGQQPAAVHFFIDRGANDWNYALGVAVEVNNRDLIDLFVQKGITNWKEAMITAIYKRNLDLIQYLLQKQPKEFWANYKHISDFIARSARIGSKPMVDLFLNCEPVNIDYNECLSSACCSGNLELIQLWLPHITDKNYALYVAAFTYDRTAIDSLLATYPDLDPNFGLFGACQGGHLDLVEFFVERGAMENYVWMAKQRGHTAVVTWLTEQLWSESENEDSDWESFHQYAEYVMEENWDDYYSSYHELLDCLECELDPPEPEDDI